MPEVPPNGLKFRLALAKDREAITKLMAERNPAEDVNEVIKKTDREIALTAFDPTYRLFVADLDGKALGLCRYFHSESISKSKLVFPAPHGWYGMGILVAPEFRRQGIARFLFQNRLQALRQHGADAIYSIVDSTNLTSNRMHERFGFEELERAAEFLHLKFDSGAIFYRMVI